MVRKQLLRQALAEQKIGNRNEGTALLVWRELLS
jgi:hypothetical protein